PKNSSWNNPRNYIETFLEASEDWVNSVFESLGIKRQRRKKADSLLRSVPVTLKPSKRKRGEVGKQALTVELCEDDPDEASKEIKRHMFQTEAWVRSFNKAIKSVNGKLRQAVKSLDLSRGTEVSLLSEVKKLKQDLGVITDLFDERLELQWARLKKFIEDKGYDPDTLKPYPVTPELVDGGDLQMKEADVVDEAAGGTGGGVDTSVVGVTSGGTVDGMVIEGLNPSTEVIVGIGVGGPVDEEGVTAPI
ncbi:hypothetical protein GIB67_015428, partial [Kingdonia uniflora]